MNTPILIFGAKEKGQIALEIFQSNGLMVYGFLDDDDTLQGVDKASGHVTVLGGTQDRDYLDLLGEKCHPFIAMESLHACKETIDKLTQANKLHPLNAIHPSTNLSKEARLGAGNMVYMGTSIGSGTMIGNYCTLMGHNMIGYGASLHDFVYLGGGAIVNPGVTIHEEAYIGSGAILYSGVTIGAQARIAPGAVVMEDIPEGGVVVNKTTSTVQNIKDQTPKP